MQHRLAADRKVPLDGAMVLEQSNIHSKLEALPEVLQALLGGTEIFSVPETPGRDLLTLPIVQLPGALGLTPLGQQKLLHDLANIELQAMELGIRTLIEFPWAPQEFREELAEIALQEGKHLRLCLQGLETLGGHWGQWPVHLGLWNATQSSDTLLQRLFIVHRYLEGSGLDAGESILKKISGLDNKVLKQTVKTIVEEEVAHVKFGSKWFCYFSQKFSIDEPMFFTRMSEKLMKSHPRREKVSRNLRTQAGFTEFEIKSLIDLRP